MLCLPDVPEVICCVPVCMLETMEGMRYVRELLEVISMCLRLWNVRCEPLDMQELLEVML